MKLHLGCGGKYLNGYINIDYPSEKHTVQEALVADVHADIKLLTYPQNTIDEIRLHHVFEHFPRPTACALIASWNFWLKPGGLLRIEVPDFSRMGWVMISPFSTFKRKAEAERHIFGSQEAEWGIHYEGYTPRMLKKFLELYGFKTKKIMKNRWLGSRNFEIFAIRQDKKCSKEHFELVTLNYLSKFLIDESPTELSLLNIWMKKYYDQVDISWVT
jgi:predicted SAM-dependent methyltransferase